MIGRRWLAVLGLLAACAAPRAAAQEAPPATEEAAAEAVVQADEGQVETQSGGYTTTTQPREVTTTTHKPYETTTTERATTTTEKATTTTATTQPREVTTTTAAATTTTQGATTTTAGATTTSQAATTTTEAPKKVFVCKYVGKPGVDERLQTGDNPISVSVNAIPLGNVQIGSEFADAQGRSVVIAFDTGQPEPGLDQCPPPNGGTTTTAAATTTTAGSTTTSSSSSTTSSTSSTSTSSTSSTSTTIPRPSLFAISAVVPLCVNGQPFISITFGARPDLNGQTGTLSFSTGGSVPLTFVSGGTVNVAWPAGAGDIALLTYTLGTETATAGPLSFPEGCTAVTTTTGVTTSTGVTTTSGPTTTGPTTTAGSTTTQPGQTTTTAPGATTTTIRGGTTTTTSTTLPPGQPFSFGAAATVCVAEVPTIRITFVTPAQFPSLVGQTGTLTMASVATGAVLSTQPLVYAPGTTVDLLYPGTRVNADGTIADVPGWNLNAAGFWVRDPADEFLRAGIQLTYVLNPTATALVTYPPESSTCANPPGPFPPGQTPPPGTPRTPGTPITPGAPGQPGSPPRNGLPPTGSETNIMTAIAFASLGAGTLLLVGTRRRKA